MSAIDAGAPTWSVMIPAYNPTEHLRVALESVLAAQRELGEPMQIEVVDDASPAMDVSALLSTWGIGGVTVYRRKVNGGLAACWNDCVERASGELIHILHQDDLVAPQFYRRMRDEALRYPSAGMFFCRNVFLAGEERRLSDLELAETGPIDDWLSRICAGQRVQCPAVALRRSTYDRVGRFNPALRWVIDWEMWIRVALATQVVYLTEALATYRVHAGAETNRLKMSGAIAHDLARGLASIRPRLARAGRRDCIEAATLYVWFVSGTAAVEATSQGRTDIARHELAASLRHFGTRVGLRLLYARLRWFISLPRRPASLQPG